MPHRRIPSLVVLAAGVVAMGCGDPTETLRRGIPPVTVSPTSLSTAPGGRARITFVDARGTALRPTGVSIDSACVAAATADGDVTGVGPGKATVTFTVITNGETFTIGIPVTVFAPVVQPLTLESVVSGETQQPIDLQAVRGTIVLRVNIDVGRHQGVELRLAGRSLFPPAFGPERPWESAIVTVPFVVNTAALDPAGRPLFANGPQTLEVIAIRDQLLPGCDAGASRLSIPLTVANP